MGPVYDKLSRIYDIWGRLTESRARSRAIELAAIKDGQNILEVAVGTGIAFYEIVKRIPTVIMWASTYPRECWIRQGSG